MDLQPLLYWGVHNDDLHVYHGSQATSDKSHHQSDICLSFCDELLHLHVVIFCYMFPYEAVFRSRIVLGMKPLDTVNSNCGVKSVFYLVGEGN